MYKASQTNQVSNDSRKPNCVRSAIRIGLEGRSNGQRGRIEILQQPRVSQAFKKTLLKGILTALSLTIFLYSGYKLYQLHIPLSSSLAENEPVQIQTKTQLLEKSLEDPVRLKIPKIHVDTSVEDVGVSPLGTMEVPSAATDVGWFHLGPRPGERGSAVIAGHLDDESGRAGVFTNLYKLKQGDKLFIEDGQGKLITFVVSSSRTYDPGFADEVFNQMDSAHLNLITCDGVWIGAKKSYSKRLVVFADIVD